MLILNHNHAVHFLSEDKESQGNHNIRLYTGQHLSSKISAICMCDGTNVDFTVSWFEMMIMMCIGAVIGKRLGLGKGFDSRHTRFVGEVINQCSQTCSSMTGVPLVWYRPAAMLPWGNIGAERTACCGMLCHNGNGSWSFPGELSRLSLSQFSFFFITVECPFFHLYCDGRIWGTSRKHASTDEMEGSFAFGPSSKACFVITIQNQSETKKMERDDFSHCISTLTAWNSYFPLLKHQTSSTWYLAQEQQLHQCRRQGLVRTFLLKLKCPLQIV